MANKSKADAVKRSTYDRQMESFEAMATTLIAGGMDATKANNYVDKKRSEYATHHRVKASKGGHVEALKLASKDWAVVLTEIEKLMTKLNKWFLIKKFTLISRAGKTGVPALSIKVEIVSSDD